MNKNQFTSVVKHFGENIQYYKSKKNSYNEDSCRIEYIDKLLSFFGWDVNNEQNVQPQYREVIVEKFDENMNRPDYTLTYRGITKLFIEAKKPSVDILNSIDSIMQTRKYGWNAKHKISVLTNFEFLVIYDTSLVPLNSDDFSVGLFRKYHFSEYISKYDEIHQLLSKQSIYDGSFDLHLSTLIIENERHYKYVDDYFLEKMNKWRIKISNDLYETNSSKYSDLGFLNDSVQRFINKLVFLRICEDRNLSKYHKLKDISQMNDKLINRLNELFMEADLKYNSGLFKLNEITFDLSNYNIMEIIEDLYYPQSPYMFNIIEPNILGKIYEMFLTESLVIDGNKIVLAKKKECINRSIVTTPVEIVKFMVGDSLGKILEGRTPDEIQEMKFGDIACGSGIFLEEIFDYISNFFINWYLLNKPDILEYSDRGLYKLPISIKRDILKNCIFGIDIDLQAVEVTKFSLLIKLLEGETRATIENDLPILPVIDLNIQCGNSLIDEGQLSIFEFKHSDLYEIVPFNWENIVIDKPFDLIIGNPPYVKTEDMHNLLNEVEFNVYREFYTSAYKQFDKYFIFIERAIKHLNQDGYLSFIVPNKFQKIGSGLKLREILSENKPLIEIYDFGDTQLFKDKTIYSSILTYKKSSDDTFVYKTITNLHDLLIGNFVSETRMRVSNLNNDLWSFNADIYLKEIKDKVKPITNFVDIFNGIQTSAERPKPIYWFTSNEIYSSDESNYYIRKNGKSYKIEKEITKDYFKPVTKVEKGLNSYSKLITNKVIIFPYNKRGKLINHFEFQQDFPGTFEYLMDNYEKLVPKQVNPEIGTRDVPRADNQTWYQYGRTQGLTAFIDVRKLIVGVLSREPMYIIDDDDMLISSGGTAGYCAITLKDDCPYSLEYIQAWLSASITEKIIRDYGSPFEGGFISRGTSVLKKIKIYPLDLNNSEDYSIHEFIVSNSNEISQINNLLSIEDNRLKCKILEDRKLKLIKDIDDTIVNIYQRGRTT